MATKISSKTASRKPAAHAAEPRLLLLTSRPVHPNQIEIKKVERKKTRKVEEKI